MPKKNNKQSYWIEREKDNLTTELMKDEQVSNEVKRILENAMNMCRKEMESYYTRFADKEGITVSEAKKLVSEYDVTEYETLARQYVKDKDFSDEANKRLRLYNVSMKVNREELLLATLNTHLIAATNDVHHKVDEYLQDGAMRELKRQAGLLGNISVKQSDIDSIINASYYDATWSKRLWSNMDEVRKIVDETAISTVLKGRHPKESVKRLRELTGRSDYEARRLLITEVSRVQIEAKRLSFKDLGVIKYKYLAVLDNRTTHTCRSLNDKVFDVSDMKPGINAPPMHAFCRSTIIPYSRKEDSDWDEEDGDLYIDDEQIEREADAENDAVIADIDDIIERLDQLDIQEVKRAVKKVENNQPPYLTDNYNRALNEEEQQNVLEQLNKADRRAVQLFNQYADVKIKKDDNTYYDFDSNAIHIEEDYMDFGVEGSHETEYARPFFHEVGHAIDSNYANSTGMGKLFAASLLMHNSDNEDISDIAKNEWQNLIKRTMRQHHVDEGKAMDIIAKKITNRKQSDWIALSSIVEGITEGGYHFGYGHGPGYWKDYSSLTTEIFAELYSLLVTNLKAYKYIATVFPETVSMFEQIINYMLEE